MLQFCIQTNPRNSLTTYLDRLLVFLWIKSGFSSFLLLARNTRTRVHIHSPLSIAFFSFSAHVYRTYYIHIHIYGNFFELSYLRTFKVMGWNEPFCMDFSTGGDKRFDHILIQISQTFHLLASFFSKEIYEGPSMLYGAMHDVIYITHIVLLFRFCFTMWFVSCEFVVWHFCDNVSLPHNQNSSDVRSGVVFHFFHNLIILIWTAATGWNDKMKHWRLSRYMKILHAVRYAIHGDKKYPK